MDIEPDVTTRYPHDQNMEEYMHKRSIVPAALAAATLVLGLRAASAETPSALSQLLAQAPEGGMPASTPVPPARAITPAVPAEDGALQEQLALLNELVGPLDWTYKRQIQIDRDFATASADILMLEIPGNGAWPKDFFQRADMRAKINRWFSALQEEQFNKGRVLGIAMKLYNQGQLARLDPRFQEQVKKQLQYLSGPDKDIAKVRAKLLEMRQGAAGSIPAEMDYYITASVIAADKTLNDIRMFNQEIREKMSKPRP